MQISWPDGKPRALTDLVWQVNGRRQPALNTIQPNSQGQLQLAWNMELATEGRYELVVDVADEFGFAATSPLVALEVVVERPLLPPPPRCPPRRLPPSQRAVMPGDPLMWLKIIGGLGVTAVCCCSSPGGAHANRALPRREGRHPQTAPRRRPAAAYAAHHL
ncbi:MAG: hypothetical protein M5U34_41760 [Chloroflexi bacterium]|nr:hypothetical protein [Chloroflexota bacterium]